MISHTMAVEGRVRVGDTLDLGLDARGGGAVVSIHFTEKHLSLAKAGMTLKHLNADGSRAMELVHVHTAGWQDDHTSIADRFVDTLLPRDYKRVKMPQTYCGHVKSVADAIFDHQSMYLCGRLAPPHLHWTMDYGAEEIVVTHEGTTVSFYISDRTPDPVADALYYFDKANDDIKSWYLIGKLKSGVEAHLSISRFFNKAFVGNEFDLIQSEDPLEENTSNAKRVLSATESLCDDDDDDDDESTPKSPYAKKCRHSDL